MKTRWITLFALGIIGAIANPVSKQTITSDDKNPQQSSIESQTVREESTLNNSDEQKKSETIDTPESSASDDRNYDDKVEIIIQESVTSPIDEAPRPIENFPSLIDDVPSPIDEVLRPVDEVPSPIDDVFRRIDDVPSPINDVLRPIDEVPSPIDDVPRPIDLPNPIDYLPRPIDDTLISFDVAPQIPNGFEDDFPVNDVPFRDAPMNTIQDEIMETAAGFVPTPLVFRRKQKPRRRFATRRHFKPNPFRRKFHFFYPYYGFYHHPSSLRFY